MSFTALLRQTISVKSMDGARDLHGKRALGTATEYRARFERTYKTIVTAEREREPIHAVVFVGKDADIEVGAQVTYDSQEYRVLERSDVAGRNGRVHHYELMLQLWSFNS